MMKLTVRNLSTPQIDAFHTLFPNLVKAGLVERRGATGLVISLHPQVFRRADRQVTAGQQLARSVKKLYPIRGGVYLGVQERTMQSLSTKLNGLVAEPA